MTHSLPDWQLPPGVSRGLWDYLHDPGIARTYDQHLANSTLFTVDQHFAAEYFDQPGRLIDLGCGTGRLLIPFAQRGYWVLGVDLSEEMLKQVGLKAAAAEREVHRLKANLVELQGIAAQSFDYAACLFSTLGMVSGAGQRQRVVNQAYRLLRPGGRLVLHVHNRWFDLWDPQGRRWLTRNLIQSLLGWSVGGDKPMPVHQGIAGLTLHLFTRAEACRLLQRAGFRLLEVRPVSLRKDGHLRCSRCFPALRAYGYLLAAERPA